MVKAVAEDRMTEEDTARIQRRTVLGDQIRSLRGSEMTQTDLGVKVAPFNPDNPGEVIPQTTISRWEKGKVNITLEWVLALEKAFGVRRGTLASSAGYVQSSISPEDTEEMLREDPRLHPSIRADFINVYHSYVKTSKQLAMQDMKIKNRDEVTPRRRVG